MPVSDRAHPGKTTLSVRLRDRALSVSGGYARFFEKDQSRTHTYWTRGPDGRSREC